MTRPGFRNGTHEQVALMLPWLVNGTLSEADRLQVERHLAECEECRADLAGHRRLHEALRAEPPLVFVAEPSWQRLQARLDSLDGAREAPPAGEGGRARPAVPGPAAPVSVLERPAPATRAPVRSPRPLVRWLTAAVIVQALGLGALGWRSRVAPEVPPPAYQTLSAATPAYGEGPRIRVVFTPGLTLARLGVLLRDIDAHVVDGPSGADVYTLGFSRPDPIGDEIAARLRRLRAHAEVRLAEPVEAATGSR